MLAHILKSRFIQSFEDMCMTYDFNVHISTAGVLFDAAYTQNMHYQAQMNSLQNPDPDLSTSGFDVDLSPMCGPQPWLVILLPSLTSHECEDP